MVSDEARGYVLDVGYGREHRNCKAWLSIGTQLLYHHRWSNSSKICTVPAVFAPTIVKKQGGMLAFFGTVPPIFSPNMFKKQDKMLDFEAWGLPGPP